MARRFKVATVLNLLGLILAFATFYLLMTQIIFQRTYNHDVKDYERVYLMETDHVYKEWDFSEPVCRPFADALKHLPQVESYSLVRNDVVISFPFQKGDSIVDYQYNTGNNTAVSALGAECLDGSIDWTDQDQKGIIIPASIALDYFMTTQAAGKDMILIYNMSEEATDTILCHVRGVYADFPENSDFANCIYKNMGDEDIHEFNYLYRCYVKFKAPSDSLDLYASQLKQAIIDDINHQNLDDEKYKQTLLKEIKKLHIKFTPLGDCYFEHGTFSTAARGFKSMFYVLELACLLVLIIAAINFLNFTLAESPMRVRGLNTRLVLGASRRSLRLGLCAECVIISIIACVLALGLCQLLSLHPAISYLMDGDISLNSHLALVCITLGIAVLVGIAAGTYPAIFATSFKPAVALKGAFGLTPKGITLRRVLMAVQLFISLLMVTYFGILLMQSHYIINSNYGFNKNQVLVTAVSTDNQTRDQLRQQLLSIPGVENVSFSTSLLGTIDSHYLIQTELKGHQFSYNFLWTDNHFMSTMGIKLIKGRNFEPGDTAVSIITQAAHKQWDWIELGDKISNNPENVDGDSVMVIGVCEDIHYGTMRTLNNQPYCIVILHDDYCDYVNVSVSPDADLKSTMHQADQLIERLFDGDASPFVSYNKMLEGSYTSEFRFFKVISIICIIYLIINLIGVLCITMFETEYRRKEIGIRKVSGATTREIVWMLCKRYAWLILTSFVAATPLAILFGKRTLEYFAERTTILWWIPLVALLVVGGISLATMVLQSWRAARANPVNSIKYE